MRARAVVSLPTDIRFVEVRALRASDGWDYALVLCESRDEGRFTLRGPLAPFAILATGEPLSRRELRQLVRIVNRGRVARRSGWPDDWGDDAQARGMA